MWKRDELKATLRKAPICRDIFPANDAIAPVWMGTPRILTEARKRTE